MPWLPRRRLTEPPARPAPAGVLPAARPAAVSRRRCLPPLLLAGLLALGGGPALAARPCPGGQGEALPPVAGAARLDRLLDIDLERCANDGPYLAYRGALLLLLDQPEEAAQFLERALMVAPDLAGAQIDYAHALALQGDAASAEALMRSLLARDDLPPGVRGLLEGRMAALRPPSPWRVAGLLGVRLGRDSNLNGAPARDLIPFSLPDGEGLLLLGDAYRPKAGIARLLDGIVQAQRPLPGGGRFVLRGELRARDTELTANDYQQGDFSASVALPWFRDGDATLAVGSGLVRYGGESLYRGLRAALGRDWAAVPCRPRAALDLEQRRYPSTPMLDGHYAGLTLAAQCALGHGQWGLTLRAGQDQPASDERPGGDQRRTELRLQAAWPLGGGRLEGEIQYASQRDARGYSPLLENDARRWQVRRGARLEWSMPVATRWEAYLAAEYSAQGSNLALFATESRIVWLGVRHAFGH